MRKTFSDESVENMPIRSGQFYDHIKSDDKAVFHTSQRFDPRLKK